MPAIPDAELYDPFLFCPWKAAAFRTLYDRIAPYTLVSPDRCWMLWSLARQAAGQHGNFVEVGVYRGGTAMLLREALGKNQTLHLFDTFAGMPETNPVHDLHKAGDFADTSLESVRGRMGTAGVTYHVGQIPDTFAGLENQRFAFAHVDVDIWRSVLDCCEFIYPRLSGFMVFDDYGFPSCPGARAAVDTFFTNRPEIPLILPTGQAVVFKAD